MKKLNLAKQPTFASSKILLEKTYKSLVKSDLILILILIEILV